MENEPKRTTESGQPQPDTAQHVAHAHQLLQALRERLGKHPELDEAIETLEVALSKLTLSTGGML